jgi:hypothetical protein
VCAVVRWQAEFALTQRHMNTSEESHDDVGLGSWIRRVPWWAPLYAALVGTVYQLTYWRNFHVRILEYMGFQDAIRVSIFPLLLFLGAMAVAIAGQFFVMERWLGPIALYSQPGLPRRTHTKIVLIALAVTVPVLAYFAWFEIVNWTKLGKSAELGLFMTLVTTFGFIVARKSPLSQQIRGRFARDVMIATIACALPVAFGVGTLEAWDILDGSDFLASSLLETEQLKALGGSASEPLKYLGHVGQYDFFLKGAETYILRAVDGTAFSIRRERKLDECYRVPLLELFRTTRSKLDPSVRCPAA